MADPQRLGSDRVSYDAFRTRRSLTINEGVLYRIMLRYRKHLSLAFPEGRAPGQLSPGGPPFSLAGGGLPAPQWFVGRDDRLTALDAAFEQRSSGVPPMVIISGTGGMGKTALALRWAHLNADRFPDGQLYIDLRGFHPSTTPVGPAAALQSFLEMLGVDRSSMPGTFEGQLALYRRLTAIRRLLVVADNARDSTQVDALIPSRHHRMTIVTSRNRPSRLTARRAAAMHLDRMNADEARDLLCGYLGSERVELEPVSAQAIIEHCGGMPLALSIVASRFASDPTSPWPRSPSSCRTLRRDSTH